MYCLRIIILFCFLFPSPLSAENFPTPDSIFDDDNLLIVEMRLNSYILAEDIFIYGNVEFALIPLQSFFDAIEFPILVDVVNNTAEGWYLRTDQAFFLDLNEHTLKLGNRVIELDESMRIYNEGFDIYVDIQLLEKWFPVDLDLKLSQLRLQLEATEELPIQKRIAREKLRENIGNSELRELPIVEDQYRWANWPVIDVSLNSGIRDGQQNSDRAANAGYFIQGNGDLLKMQSSFSFARPSFDEDPNARFSLKRKQSHPDKPLYSELSSIAIGDIFSVSDTLLFTSGSGIGLDLQFGDERTLSGFGNKIVEGVATPGWEVEVYRNNILLDFDTVAEDGRYRFEDLPLEYGENVFDIRLFGPQGQEDTRRETLNIGTDSLPKGEFYARLHYSNVNQSVFPQAPSFSGDEDSEESEQYGYFTYERGISNKLSLSFVSAEHGNPNNNESNRNYIGGGASYSFSRVAISAQRLSQLGEGTAHSLGLQTRLGNTSITFDHQLYNQFKSDRSDSGRIKEDIELRLSSFFGKLFKVPVSNQLLFNYERLTDQTFTFRAENRVGFNWLGGRFNWDHRSSKNNLDSQNNGTFRYLRTTSAKLNLRGSFIYDFDNGFEITNVNTTWNWHPEPNWNIQLSTNTDLKGRGGNSFIISSARRFPALLLSIDAALNEGGGGFIGLNAEFSLTRDDDRWKTSERRQANFGRLRTQVFLDNDADGKLSSPDQTLEQVRFEGSSVWRNVESNSRGVSYLSQLRDLSPSRVKLDKGSLEDPFWQSSFDEVQVVSHAGGLIDLQIPILQTVEVEGSLIMKGTKNEEDSILPGIPIQLINQEGDVVHTAISEFDGYFVINSIIPGNYLLSVHPDAIERLGANNLKPIELELSQSDGVVYLPTIELTRN